jgi:hypothetical protein
MSVVVLVPFEKNKLQKITSKRIYVYVRIEKEMGSKIEDIVRCPSCIDLQPGFGDKVTATNDIPNGDHCSVSAV